MNDIIILSLLLPGPLHGYALKKRAGFVLNHPELHNNTVYPLLNRFIRQGWVRKKEEAGERGQTRLVYSLTRQGRAELIRRLSEFTEKQAHSEHEFHLRVGLFQLLPSRERVRILETRAQVLSERGEHLAALEQQFQLKGFNAEVVSYRRSCVDSELQWIKKIARRRGEK